MPTSTTPTRPPPQNSRVQPSAKTKELIKELGKAISEARVARKMRIEDLCEEAKITKQTYQRLVQGSPGVSIGIMFTVMEVLSILPRHVSGPGYPEKPVARKRRGNSS